MKIEILKRQAFRTPRPTEITALTRRIVTAVGETRLTKAAKARWNRAETLRLVFVSTAEMRRLNRSFRGRDYATDILSFDSSEPGVLGELVLALPVLKTQARDHGLTLKDELQYMILHGVLHLLGYDHENHDKGARQMYRLQDAIFSNLRSAPKQKDQNGHRNRVVRHKKHSAPRRR